MKYAAVIACLCLSAFAPAALMFQCTPELTDMVNPGTYDVAVVSSNPGTAGTFFTIALAPTGPFTWDVPIIFGPPDYIALADWQYFEMDGIHYWSVSYADPAPALPPLPLGELFRMTFGFPEAGFSYELSLLDDIAFDRLDYRAFVVAPEPATLAILALGAFYLRRQTA